MKCTEHTEDVEEKVEKCTRGLRTGYFFAAVLNEEVTHYAYLFAYAIFQYALILPPHRFETCRGARVELKKAAACMDALSEYIKFKPDIKGSQAKI